jgi:hypothetical protein
MGSDITVIITHFNCHRLRVCHLSLVNWVAVSFVRDGCRRFCDWKILQTIAPL